MATRKDVPVVAVEAMGKKWRRIWVNGADPQDQYDQLYFGWFQAKDVEDVSRGDVIPGAFLYRSGQDNRFEIIH